MHIIGIAVGAVLGIAAAVTVANIIGMGSKIRRKKRVRIRQCSAWCLRGAHPEWRSLDPQDPRSEEFPRWLFQTWSTHATVAETLHTTQEKYERLMLAFTRQLVDDLIAEGLLDGHLAQHLMTDIRKALQSPRLNANTPLP